MLLYSQNINIVQFIYPKRKQSRLDSVSRYLGVRSRPSKPVREVSTEIERVTQGSKGIDRGFRFDDLGWERLAADQSPRDVCLSTGFLKVLPGIYIERIYALGRGLGGVVCELFADNSMKRGFVGG